MKPQFLFVPLMFTAAACDVDVEEKGRVKVPDVEVSEGDIDLPKVKVEGGRVETPKVEVVEEGDIDLPRYEVRGPDVEIEEEWIKVPTVDVDLPKENDGTAEADDEAK